MIPLRALCATLVLCAAVSGAATAGNVQSGTWAISPAADPNRVHLQLAMEDTEGHDRSSNGSDVDIERLGLSRSDLNAPGHHVAFTIVRDAGSFVADGWLGNGRGGGALDFKPSATYRSEMAGLGYNLTMQQQVAAAMQDVSTDYARSIIAVGIGKPDFGELMAFRGLGITDSYLKDLRSAGVTIDAPHEAIEVRALKIYPEYVRDLASVGYSRLSARELVEMRAMKIDAAYIRRVQAHGFPHPSVEELVRMKAMRVI
jgi:opacity protein-like surface antigen